MMMRPHDPEAYQLLHDGAITLARMEHNGIRVDTEYLDKAIEQVGRKINLLDAELKESDVWAEWRKRFGAEASLTSRPQLAVTLFDVMGFDSPGLTVSGRHKADGESLEAVDHPFIEKYVLSEQLKKVLGTYLVGTKSELSDDGFIRSFYNLHLAMTYRSSCENTNIQNQPVRNELARRLIRRMYIPRERHRLLEADFSAIEVRVACAYHKDPTMIKYIVDKYDMHRDMAAQCFMLPTDAVPKAVRHAGKNSFVFPEFYGDVYFSVAPGLWAAAVKNKLTTADGVPMLEHLASCGITSVGACDSKLRPAAGTFERHIQAIETDFWKRRFRVYDAWKREWYNDYVTRGWFKLLTGFTCGGNMRRNVVINAPVQGAAFHCLLWCLIEIQRELHKRRMKTKLVGEIHDSMLADVPDEEFDDFVELSKDVMTRRLLLRFPWLNVPIEIEIEACGLGQTWFDKKEIKL